jgi:hypothetical protein
VLPRRTHARTHARTHSRTAKAGIDLAPSFRYTGTEGQESVWLQTAHAHAHVVQGSSDRINGGRVNAHGS